jgi:phosphoribosylformylglycinamidine cyclo-ligase
VSQGASYAAAGVDIEAGDRAVELMKEWVAKATRPRCRRARRVRRAVRRDRADVVPAAAAGDLDRRVGTKVAIAQKLDKHDTIGFDLVGMVVDDLVVCGAEPLFMTDYICTGKVVPGDDRADREGHRRGVCRGGYGARRRRDRGTPGLLEADEYDVAGAATGVVEADEVLGAERVRAGDVVLAMASSGLHSNGYSLVRHVFFERASGRWTARCRSWAPRSARCC